MRLNSLLILFSMALTLSGCGGGGSTGTDSIIPSADIDVNVTITDEYQVESLGIANTINANVSVGDISKDLYLVLSNSANVPASSIITHNAKITEATQAKIMSSNIFAEKPRILHHPQYVKDFNSQISSLLSQSEESQFLAKTIAVPERIEDSVGDTYSFCTDINLDNGVCVSQTSAIARKVISVATNFGTKTLNIWVSDDSFDNGSGCSKTKCITQTMVDALADIFLASGLDNDIYDWVTNIYGEEWNSVAEAKYSNLIPANNEITILLTDIDNDGLPSPGEGRVVGFFWSKDNFDKSVFNGSNERIMFYIDSVMFANEEDLEWNIDDYWPKEMVSTLAHEFQHMIHFYQKNVLLYSNISDNTDTWINEMLSESTEDLVATKIQHTGPRGVDYLDGSAGDPGNTVGRYPLFNENNTLSLTRWDNILADYSKVNAFGAYLLRNYGGAKLFHDIMHNDSMDKQAVVDAVNNSSNGIGKTFANLLNEWGVAIILSDHDDLADTPEYNTGWFTDSVYGSTTYELGSINFFNYIPLPTINTTSGTIQSQGNYYYKIGDNLTGNIDIRIELNGETQATLIAK